MKKNVLKFAAIVSVMTFAVAIFGGTYLYARFTPAAHIVIDTDAAMELTLNRFGQVIVNRVYHSGEPNDLSRLSLAGLPLPQAVNRVVETAHLSDSFDENAPLGIFVCVHAATDARAAAMTREVSAMVAARLRALEVPCSVHGMACPDAFLAAGHNKDVSPGRLCMISALERTNNDPIEAVYERMLRYTPRQIKARYAETMGM